PRGSRVLSGGQRLDALLPCHPKASAIRILPYDHRIFIGSLQVAYEKAKPIYFAPGGEAMISDRNKRLGRAIISIILILTLISINDFATARQPGAIDNPAFPAGKSPDYGGIYNHYARFIAGMAVPQSSLASLQSRPAWVEYSRFFDRSWRNLDKRLLIPERSWSERELGAAASSDSTVFYPFSGPDF